jgi:hypothetical protein
MDSNLLLALGVVVLLLLASALGRRFFAPGWQRNTLSVAAVVLGLLAAFLVFFGAGLFMRGRHQSDNSDWPSHRVLASEVRMGGERLSSSPSPAAVTLAA